MKVNDSSSQRGHRATARITDVSRFTRWVNQLDEKEAAMSPRHRKRKWLLTVFLLVVVFVLSFFWLPPVGIGHFNPEPLLPPDSIELQTVPGMPFSIPTDSFEKQLKMRMYENFSEEE